MHVRSRKRTTGGSVQDMTERMCSNMTSLSIQLRLLAVEDFMMHSWRLAS